MGTVQPGKQSPQFQEDGKHKRGDSVRAGLKGHDAGPASGYTKKVGVATQMTVNVVLEQTPENWGAYTPDDIGCVVACGETREETIALFREALQQHLRVMREAGQTVPDVTELEIRETVAV